MFLEGGTPSGIAKTLTSEGVPSPGGRPTWVSTTIEFILTNEKYKGDAILQKSFTVNGMIENKDEILADYDEILGKLESTATLNQQIQHAKADTAEIYARMQQAVDENSRIAQDRDEYSRRFNEMNERHCQITRKTGTLKAKSVGQCGRNTAPESYVASSRAIDGLVEIFDGKLFTAPVNKVIVGRDVQLRQRNHIVRFLGSVFQH